MVLAVAAIAAVLALLAAAAFRAGPTVRGFAEFEANGDTCSLGENSLNAVRCRMVARNVYEITFSRELGNSTALATRASCCPGQIAASRTGRRRVIVSLGNEARFPVRAQVLVP